MSALRSTSRVRENNHSRKEKELLRKRSIQARKTLSEPSHVIAARARKRYEQADKAIRIPSKKPRIVKAPAKQDKTLVWIMRAFAVGIVFSLIAVVGIQTAIANRQIKINDLRALQRDEITTFEKNRHEVAKLKSPERITRRAENLGLVQPEHFISVTIPMQAEPRGGFAEDELWKEVKAIINATS